MKLSISIFTKVPERIRMWIWEGQKGEESFGKIKKEVWLFPQDLKEIQRRKAKDLTETDKALWSEQS